MGKFQCRELTNSLGKLLTDGRYSDCEILCDGKRHRVHKAVICMQSPFFQTKCHYMQESESQVIDMQEEDPVAVRMMINFLYVTDYEASSEEDRMDVHAPLDAGFSPGSVPERPPALLEHARVFALAEKYDIKALMPLAARKFEKECAKWYNDEEFAMAASEVYSTTPDYVRDLRDIVVWTIVRHRKLMKKPEMQAVMRDSLLAFDLLMELRKYIIKK